MIKNQEEFYVTDAYLSQVVDMLNHTEEAGDDGGIAVVVSFSGTVVSGIAIGAQAFFKLVSEGFLIDEKTSAEERKALANFMNPYSRSLTEEEQAKADEMAKLPPQFIHMKDAVIYTGTREITYALWRGKLSEVSGFSFGAPSDTIKKV